MYKSSISLAIRVLVLKLTYQKLPTISINFCTLTLLYEARFTSDGYVASYWPFWPFTKCFVFYTFGTGGRLCRPRVPKSLLSNILITFWNVRLVIIHSLLGCPGGLMCPKWSSISLFCYSMSPFWCCISLFLRSILYSDAQSPGWRYSLSTPAS